MNTDNPGFVLADVARLLRRTFRQRLAGIELSFEQARALMVIAHCEGIRQVDLAERLDVQPITLVHQIDQLAASGLVERRTDPADRRAYQLFVTKAAAPHLAAIGKIGAKVQSEMLRGLSKQQVALLLAGLHTMRENLTRPNP